MSFDVLIICGNGIFFQSNGIPVHESNYNQPALQELNELINGFGTISTSLNCILETYDCFFKILMINV